ncbi:MAG TPA: group II intron maturase-specific domain-containing protein, partial [Thermoleophilia bacterium]|nr:group II intron maturase-specific domain-containing protein [Thermoleophilia bacterium]
GRSTHPSYPQTLLRRPDPDDVTCPCFYPAPFPNQPGKPASGTTGDEEHLPVRAVVGQINPILRGWVNYFRVGNSSRAFDKVKFHVERKVRRWAVKKLKRKGFGWTRWSRDVVYQGWGLFNDYRIRYYSAAKASALPRGTITPM